MKKCWHMSSAVSSVQYAALQCLKCIFICAGTCLTQDWTLSTVNTDFLIVIVVATFIAIAIAITDATTDVIVNCCCCYSI